jgi:hypothetical protein
MVTALQCGFEGASLHEEISVPPQLGSARPRSLDETPAPLGEGLLSGACSIDSWCWQSPLPQGEQLSAVWGSDANNVWAVGAEGAILK